jgi:hypothetical protein
MNFDDINDELNNPSFELNKMQLVLHNISSSLYSRYYLSAILQTQIELLEVYKGKTGQELDDSINEKMEEWTDKFDEWHKTDLVDIIRDSISDE